MGLRTSVGVIYARTVLLALVAIHFVLPFTPVNPHPELRIKVASLILGALFLLLGHASFRRPFFAFAVALTLLLVVYMVSALSGASPITEGLPVKIIFAAGLAFGLIRSRGRASET